MGICAEALRMERGLQSACSWEDDGEARLRARHRLTTSRTFAGGLKSALPRVPRKCGAALLRCSYEGRPLFHRRETH